LSALLDIKGLKALVIMPEEDVDDLVARYPAFVAAQLEVLTGEIYSRLRKRYKTPFVEPVPIVAKGWLADMITPVLYARRGIDPSDDQMQQLRDAAARAREQIKEAADSENGLYDLPLLDSADGTAITKADPLGYSEGAYDYLDRERGR
jgi:hypothetical protein